MKRTPKRYFIHYKSETAGIKYQGRLKKPKTGFFEKSEHEKSALFKKHTCRYELFQTGYVF